jgi:hypothetical protein
MAGSTPIFKEAEPNSSATSKIQRKEAASSAAETDLWIFRDGRKIVSGPAMVRDLSCRISQCGKTSEFLLDSLIQAGELEAALADANSTSATAASRVTDALAFAMCTGRPEDVPDLEQVRQITAPESIEISPPEGFTYYALHPLDFARVVSGIPAKPEPCAVIGIRSIGTTLSAMAAASLKAEGRRAERITVRPTGHPYARITEFAPEQIRWIREQMFAPCQFLIVDEGPGRSGSTFLSVAEALIRADVPRELIMILGSRDPDPKSLCAVHAAARWQAFQYLAVVPSVNTRFEKCLYLGGGYWRGFLCGDEENWPESWTQMERLKFLSPDRQTFFKFEGMGPIGSEVRERAFVLAEAGLSPRVTDEGDGFLAYAMLDGRQLRTEDLSTPLLDSIACYCAFRTSNFICRDSAPAELRQMLEFNLHQEFGVDVKLCDSEFISQHPVLADGRMQPYEWIATVDDTFMKTDAISHGDNHFFPGPCDIAWDLAGTAVEWQLGPDALAYLLERFRQISGINASRQLPLYMLAYSVFRLGYCKMAISTVPGLAEEQRLISAYVHYRTAANRVLKALAESRSSLATCPA